MARGNFHCPNYANTICNLNFCNWFFIKRTFPTQGQLSPEKGDEFCIRCLVDHMNWLPMRTILLDPLRQDNVQTHKQSRGILKTWMKEFKILNVSNKIINLSDEDFVEVAHTNRIVLIVVISNT